MLRHNGHTDQTMAWWPVKCWLWQMHRWVAVLRNIFTYKKIKYNKKPCHMQRDTEWLSQPHHIQRNHWNKKRKNNRNNSNNKPTSNSWMTIILFYFFSLFSSLFSAFFFFFLFKLCVFKPFTWRCLSGCFTSSSDAINNTNICFCVPKLKSQDENRTPCRNGTWLEVIIRTTGHLSRIFVFHLDFFYFTFLLTCITKCISVWAVISKWDPNIKCDNGNLVDWIDWK